MTVGPSGGGQDIDEAPIRKRQAPGLQAGSVAPGPVAKQHRLLIVTTIEATLSAFLTPLARRMREKGWAVDAMAQGATTSRAADSFDSCIDAPWRRRNWNPWLLARGVSAVRRAIAAGSYDIVHVHTPVAAFLTRFALRRSRFPVVLYTSHGFHFHSGGRRLTNKVFVAIERIAGRWTDFIVVINHEDLEAAIDLGIAPPGRVTLIPGVGIELSKHSREDFSTEVVAHQRALLELDPAETLLVSVGELNSMKRHLDLVRALDQLGRSDVHLAIAGQGPMAKRILHEARRRGIERQIHLVGWRDDVPALVVSATVLLHPSGREGLPVSVMEAMALETPVIGARTRGTVDLLDGGGGLLHDIGDIDAIVGLIAGLLDDPTRAELLGKAGRDAVRRFNLDEVLDQYERLYLSLIGGGATLREVGWG